MPGIIIKNETFRPDDEKYDFYAGSGYKEYLENDKLHPMEKKDGSLSNENINTMKEYMARTDYFSGRGGLNNLEIFDKDNNIFHASDKHTTDPAHGSNIYSLVLSFPPEISNQKDFSKQEMQDYARTLFTNVIRSNAKWGFDAKYFNFYACVHDKNFSDKEHPNDHTHLHMVIYQPKGTPKDKLVERYKLSLFGFNNAKLEIANKIDVLKDKPEMVKSIFDSKKDIQETFRNKLKEKSNVDIWKVTEWECDKQFNQLCKAQKQVYKLFKAQDNEFIYTDKKTGLKHKKTGLGLYYDNLSVPIYSLKDLELVKSKKKSLQDCKKEIQPEQIMYKQMIDNYASTVLNADEELNSKNKQFKQFCEAYKQDRMIFVGGNEKSPEEKDSMNKILDYKLDRMVFKELQTNIGNEIIKCVTADNVKNNSNSTKSNKSNHKPVARVQEWEKDKKQEQKFTETDYMFVLGDLHHSSNTMQSLNNILRDEKLFDNIKHYLGIDDPDTRFQYDSENMFSDEYLVSNCLMDDLEHYSEQKQQCALENQPELKQEYKEKDR